GPPSRRRRLAAWGLVVVAAGAAVAGWQIRARGYAPVARSVVEATGCGRSGPVTVEIYGDRAAFDAAVGARRVLDFDDLGTAAGTAELAADRYAASHGVILRGTEGQFVDRAFGHPTDFSAASPPNSYAPGPKAPVDSPVAAGGHETELTFQEGGRAACVAGV